MLKVHFLGIGGSGASAAAALAQTQDFEVSGCDLEPLNEFTKVFHDKQLFKNHSSSHILDKEIDILAVTPAIYSLDPDNPELLAAKKKGITIMTWQQFLGEYLTKGRFVIAVCGTHGKTTTTAMIAQMLEDSRLDPIVEIGAIVPRWKANYRVGQGKYFVVEADEFNDNFLHLKPDITVVTNIEMDHPEFFKDFEKVKESFKKFLLQTKGTIVANLSDEGVGEVLKFVMKETSTPAIDYSKNELGLKLKIPGQFNLLNASAAFQVGLLLNIDPSIIKKSLENYQGVGRRFEYIGEYQEAKVYSDFGHHPTEIKVTVNAVREKFPKSRILLIYQPHMFSRTKFLFDDFVKVFKSIPADKIFIIDIYKSREIDTGLVTSKQLVETVNKSTVSYIGNASETLGKLKPEIQKGDIVFFMSAGDTDKIARELVRSNKIIGQDKRSNRRTGC